MIENKYLYIKSLENIFHIYIWKMINICLSVHLRIGTVNLNAPFFGFLSKPIFYA